MLFPADFSCTFRDCQNVILVDTAIDDAMTKREAAVVDSSQTRYQIDTGIYVYDHALKVKYTFTLAMVQPQVKSDGHDA